MWAACAAMQTSPHNHPLYPLKPPHVATLNRWPGFGSILSLAQTPFLHCVPLSVESFTTYTRADAALKGIALKNSRRVVIDARRITSRFCDKTVPNYGESFASFFFFIGNMYTPQLRMTFVCFGSLFKKKLHRVVGVCENGHRVRTLEIEVKRGMTAEKKQLVM